MDTSPIRSALEETAPFRAPEQEETAPFRLHKTRRVMIIFVIVAVCFAVFAASYAGAYYLRGQRTITVPVIVKSTATHTQTRIVNHRTIVTVPAPAPAPAPVHAPDHHKQPPKHHHHHHHHPPKG